MGRFRGSRRFRAQYAVGQILLSAFATPLRPWVVMAGDSHVSGGCSGRSGRLRQVTGQRELMQRWREGGLGDPSVVQGGTGTGPGGEVFSAARVVGGVGQNGIVVAVRGSYAGWRVNW